MIQRGLVMRKPVKESSDFEKRILEYSAVAGVILASTSPSLLKAAVHKTTVNVTNQTNYAIDFDGVDNDLIFSVYSNKLIVWDDGNPIGYSGAGGRRFASVLNSGDLISPGMNFIASALAWYGGGPWLGVNNKFLGVEFKIGSTPYYGWVKISVHSDCTFDVLEFAYEDVQGLGILAGSDVSLPVELTEFSAVLMDDGVKLAWITESETDNAGFILERQAAGESDWLNIASYETHTALAGQGNTSSRTEYGFMDVNVFMGETYRYRLSDVDMEGNITINDVIEIFVDESVVPEETKIEQVYPNPFNPDTKIHYKLAEDAHVTLRVVDLIGRTVNTVVQDAYQSAGSHVVYWNGKSADDQPSASGVYFLVLQAGSVLKTQKVVLVR